MPTITIHLVLYQQSPFSVAEDYMLAWHAGKCLSKLYAVHDSVCDEFEVL